MSKIDLISNDWTDLVFDGRNQAYGAYQLRRNTSKRNIWAMVFVAAVAALAYIGLSAYNSYQEAQKARFEAEMEASLLEQKKEAKVERKAEAPKVEKAQVVERVKSSIAFTPPVIKKDSEVRPEDELKSQEELLQTKTAIKSLLSRWASKQTKSILPAFHLRCHSMYSLHLFIAFPDLSMPTSSARPMPSNTMPSNRDK